MNESVLSNAAKLSEISAGEAISMLAVTLLAAAAMYGMVWLAGKGLHVSHERWPRIIPDAPRWF